MSPVDIKRVDVLAQQLIAEGHDVADVSDALLFVAASYATLPIEFDGHSNVVTCGLCFIRRAAEHHNNGMLDLKDQIDDAGRVKNGN